MRSIIKHFISICLGFCIGIISTLWIQEIYKEAARREETNRREETKQNVDSVIVKWKSEHFLLSEENLYNELIAQEVNFPEVVLAQAVLETGHFKSHACLHRNNLFGLRNKEGVYMTFNHWTASVAAYKKYIQKYDTLPQDYYHFLDSLGYAEDDKYLIKIKALVKDYDQRRGKE